MWISCSKFTYIGILESSKDNYRNFNISLISCKSKKIHFFWNFDLRFHEFGVLLFSIWKLMYRGCILTQKLICHDKIWQNWNESHADTKCICPVFFHIRSFFILFWCFMSQFDKMEMSRSHKVHWPSIFTH